MATFVLVHGAFSGAWSWNRFVVPQLRASGHTVFATTLTGLGDRTHLAHPGIDLDTHVQDVVNVLYYEHLHDVILVGHSYGGKVITGVADRSADRLAHLVYLDAIVPTPLDPVAIPISPEMQVRIDTDGDGWRIPPDMSDPLTASEAWRRQRLSGIPVRTFTQPVRFSNPPPALARTFVYFTEGKGPASWMTAAAARVRDDPDWTYHELEATHNLYLSAPDATVAILAGIGDVQDALRP